MRTYYIHGKLTRTGFHLIATLSKSPPGLYEYIQQQEARTIMDALRSSVRTSGLSPVRSKLVVNGEHQANFIQDVRE